MAPITWQTVLLDWHVSPGWDVALAAAAVAYAAGLLQCRRTRMAWQWGRSACFTAALAVLALTVSSGISTYAHPLFSMHMVEHLLLIMVVPALLVWGAPLALLRATAPLAPGPLPRIARLTFDAASHPLVGLAMYTLVVFATHLSSFMQLMLGHPAIHHAEEVLYLLTGWLFLLPLIGREPVRYQLAQPVRIFVFFIAMIVDTIVGVVLLQAPTNPFPGYAAMDRRWGPTPLEDLHLGAAVMWVGGDMLMLVLLLAAGVRWLTDESTQRGFGRWLEGARRETLAQGLSRDGRDALRRADDLDEDEDALAAYNAMLARLDSRTSGQHADT